MQKKINIYKDNVQNYTFVCFLKAGNMGTEYGIYDRQEKQTQSFGRKIWGKNPTWKIGVKFKEKLQKWILKKQLTDYEVN